jgi:hypothetical protein
MANNHATKKMTYWVWISDNSSGIASGVDRHHPNPPAEPRCRIFTVILFFSRLKNRINTFIMKLPSFFIEISFNKG